MNKTKALIAVVAVAVIGFVASRFIPKTEDQILVPPTEPTTKETTSSTSSGTYKDGSYSAKGVYYSPEGLEQITVNVTLKNGIITDTSAEKGANDATSVRYQGIFIANYKQYVIGKNIADVKLTKVSGSSLTGEGFNNALEKIKGEASQA